MNRCIGTAAQEALFHSGYNAVVRVGQKGPLNPRATTIIPVTSIRVVGIGIGVRNAFGEIPGMSPNALPTHHTSVILVYAMKSASSFANDGKVMVFGLAPKA